ncbi:MAG: OmpA family protein [Aurantimonas endophytica]|uniref:OmpA family protein n=1 Tax=Aurantimonas endophytica TaxID=1522175 RepID=UPI0030014CAA
MPNLKRTGRFVGVAALAASTALSGPFAAYAQDAAPYRLAQAEEPAPVVVPDVAAPEAPVVEEPAPAPEPEAPAVEEPAPAPEAPPVEEPAPAPEPAPEPEVPAEAPAVEEPPVEEPAAEVPPAEEPAPEAPVEEPAPEAPPVEEPAAEAPVETPAEAAPEPAPEPEAAPAAETPAVEEAPAAEEVAPAAPVEPAPSAEEAAPADAVPETLDAPVESPAGEPAPVPESEAPAETAPANAVPTDSAPAADAPADAAAPTPDAAAPAPADAPAPAGDVAAPSPEAAAAPVAPPPPVEAAEPVSAEIQNEPVPEGGVSQSDARVQQLAEPVEVRSARSEAGERIEAPAGSTTINNSSVTNNTVVNNTTTNTTNTVVQQAPLPPGAEVVERVGNRDILSIVGAGVAGAVVGGAAAYFIRGNDDDRIAVDAEERYYERLPRERTRQTVVRDNGVQIVTITNRYGDVIQRSRVMPDGREVVLFYDPYERDYDDDDYYEDPAAGWDPVDLRIPMDEYIVDTREPDEDLYYRTIVAPPVERVDRIYSVNEVRRSERIRDKVRRIDLSTINFAFGSDAISQEQVPNLQALADAIARVIEQNPAETFLIEGHTDAVGSDLANLALSDRRAEGVASALTDYFDVPPENLVTQGYGEQFLKVDTQEENAENRRVTVRRITPLVKPVESAAR